MLHCQIKYSMNQYPKWDNLHWVSGSDVFAGCLYYRFTSFIQSSVDAVICTRVSLLNQGLQLDLKKKKIRKKKSLTHQGRAVSSLQIVPWSGTSQWTLSRYYNCHWPRSRAPAKYFPTGFSVLSTSFSISAMVGIACLPVWTIPGHLQSKRSLQYKGCLFLHVCLFVNQIAKSDNNSRPSRNWVEKRK